MGTCESLSRGQGKAGRGQIEKVGECGVWTLRWVLSLSCLLNPGKAYSVTPSVVVLGVTAAGPGGFFPGQSPSAGEGRPRAIHLLGRSQGTVRFVHLET